MSAILFGSISTLADTSEEQRAAFNEAFNRHGLDWHWSQDDYRAMLAGNGGKDRIAAYAAERGDEVDAAAVHETKSQLFREKLATLPIRPRPGVAEVIADARENGWQVGLVTTTSADNVAGLFGALDGYVSSADFDVIVDSSAVDQPKPAPDAYRFALDKLGISAGDAVAIEDNVGGAQSAADAGVACVAFPNENTVLQDFGSTPTARRLYFAELQTTLANR